MSASQFNLFEWPRWAEMWALALAVYGACKWLTWRRASTRHVAMWKHCAYLLAWPGMDAASYFALTVMFAGFTVVYACAALH